MGDKKTNIGISNIIGEGTEIQGKVLVPGSIRIDGKIDGELMVTEQITIGKTGFVKGSIKTKNAIIAGRVEGNVLINNKIELQKNAKVNIDLHCKLLVIQEGVIFDGTCSMSDSSTNVNREIKK